MIIRLRTPMCVAVLLTLIAGSSVAADRSRDEYEFNDTKTFEVGANPDVSVRTISGDITYTGSDTETATVRMTIVVRADNEEEAERIRDAIDLTLDGGDGFLDLRVEYPHDDFHRWLRREFGKNCSISVNFDVRGPEDAEGELSSVSGDIELDNSGSMAVGTVSGDVTVDDVAGRLQANSVSGSVTVTGCTGRARTESVSGDILVERCGGDLSAHSTSGNVEASGIDGSVDGGTVSGRLILRDIGGEVSASTTSGDITVEHQSGDLTIETISGDVRARSMSEARLSATSLSGTIEIAVRADAIGEISLETFSGDIETDAPVKVRRQSRRRLIGRMGDGNGRLEIETHSGDIIVSSL
ncbi:MAG TPA: DUF4097 family beta strand repeat-containing protein [Acidobacteriota bacterium]|nr:DUF4097 family beta strand repeat-containing protein [Acidobacteriota bacterium]